MSILVYGGGFNPPHPGHVAALKSAVAALEPSLSLVIPDGTPPHKPLPAGTPDGESRLTMCRLAFRDIPRTQVSELAVFREGPCYMVDTLEELRKRYPGEELILLVGTDMLLCLDRWYRGDELLRSCTVAALCRRDGERDALEKKIRELSQSYGTRVVLVQHSPVPVSSSRIRELLPRRQGRELLDAEVYREIVRCRAYGAKPELSWLREQLASMLDGKRFQHVLGCEQEARRLAERWDYSQDDAAEAGILHDCTKRWSAEEHLRFCAEQGIALDEGELANPLLFHARTGAVAAKALFGAPEEICDAIRWHTTGKPAMTLFEKILYIADMIEPNRDFPGVEKLRLLAYQDLDAAMAEALRQSVASIRQRNLTVYKDTLEAYRWYTSQVPENKEE